MAPNAGRGGRGRGRYPSGGRGRNRNHSRFTTGVPNPPTSSPPSFGHAFCSRSSHQGTQAAAAEPDAMKLVTLTVGPDKKVFTVLPAPASLEEPIPKARAFDDLLSKLMPFVNSLGPCSVLRAIADHIPSPSVQAEQEADFVVASIRKELYRVTNIEPCNFVDPDGNAVATIDTDPRRRASVAFVEVHIRIVPSTIDPRLSDVPPFQERCLLRLPQSVKPPSQAQAQAQANAPSPPVNRALNLLSPSMQRLTSAVAPSNCTYTGTLDFDKDQAKFDSVFGDTPQLLCPRDGRPESVEVIINDYLNKCRLHVFIPALRLDYVGVAHVDTGVMMQDTVRALHSLKMATLLPSGQVDTCGVAQLYDAFVNAASLLPADATSWTVNLVTTFWNALTPSLQDDILTTGGYTLPTTVHSANGLEQRRLLRELRQKAAEAESRLHKDADKISALLTMHGVMPRSSHAASAYAQASTQDTESTVWYSDNSAACDYVESPPTHADATAAEHDAFHSDHAYSAYSPAEQTMQKYARVDLQDFNQDTVSVPMDFRGCLVCFKDHKFKECPHREREGCLELFFHNLHTLKPRNPNRDASGVERKSRSSSEPSPRPSSPGPPSRPTSPGPNPPEPLQSPRSPRHHSLGRGRDATLPAWHTASAGASSRSHYGPGGDSKRARTSYLGIGISMQAPSVRTRPAPININNGLPHILFPLGRPEDGSPGVDLRMLYDSGSAVNIGNKSHHLSIRHARPDLVFEYLEFDDPTHSFDPISLLGVNALPPGVPPPKWDQLSAIIRYRTELQTPDGEPFYLSVCVGDNVSTNTILGYADITNYGMDLMVSKQLVVSELLQAEFLIIPQEPLLGSDLSSAAITQLASLPLPPRKVQFTEPPALPDTKRPAEPTPDSSAATPNSKRPRTTSLCSASATSTTPDHSSPLPTIDISQTLASVAPPPPTEISQAPASAIITSPTEPTATMQPPFPPIAQTPPPAPASPPPLPAAAKASTLPGLAASRHTYQICCGEVSPFDANAFTSELSEALPTAAAPRGDHDSAHMSTTPPTAATSPAPSALPVTPQPLVQPEPAHAYIAEVHGPAYYTRSISRTPPSS